MVGRTDRYERSTTLPMFCWFTWSNNCRKAQLAIIRCQPNLVFDGRSLKFRDICQNGKPVLINSFSSQFCISADKGNHRDKTFISLGPWKSREQLNRYKGRVNKTSASILISRLSKLKEARVQQDFLTLTLTIETLHRYLVLRPKNSKLGVVVYWPFSFICRCMF